MQRQIRHALHGLLTGVLLSSAGPSAVMAHGALTGDADTCKLSVGPYAMHFTGYQPSQAGNQEFCEDIPNAGQTIIVLESLDDALRGMEVSIRIAEDRPGQIDLEQGTVYLQPFRQNARGSITVMHNFAGTGRFIGVVTARHGDGEYVARFPFSVGLPAAPAAASSTGEGIPAHLLWGTVAIGLSILLLAGMIVVIRGRGPGTVGLSRHNAGAL